MLAAKNILASCGLMVGSWLSGGLVDWWTGQLGISWGKATPVRFSAPSILKPVAAPIITLQCGVSVITMVFEDDHKLKVKELECYSNNF